MRKHPVIGPTSGVAMALVWAGTLTACQPPAADLPSRDDEDAELDPAARLTAEVIGTLHWLHLVEIERAEVVRRQAARDDVRAFADRVVRDHRQLDRRLIQLAERMQVRPRPAVGAPGWPPESMRELEELAGVELDRAYLKATIDSHDRMISRFIEAQAVADEVLAQHIGSALPLMMQHRDLAFRLLSRMPTA
jgi:predicted outer membrane protein